MEQSQLGKGLNLGRRKQVVPLGDCSSSSGHCWCLFKQWPQSSPDLWPQPLYHRSPLNTYQESTWILWSSSNTGQGSDLCLCLGPTCFSTPLLCCKGPRAGKGRKVDWKQSQLGLILMFLLQQLGIRLHCQKGGDGHRAERRLCLTPALAPPPPASPSAKMTAASVSWSQMWCEPTWSPALLPKALGARSL